MLEGRPARRGSAGVRPVKLGVIGLGAVAQAVHLPLLRKRPDLFDPVAVCDVSPSACDRIGDRLRLPRSRRFRSAADLIEAGGIDAVCVLTAGSHGALAADAARAGLAVFCEKPLAYSLAEADALAALAPRLQLGYMKLYDPAVERARELLAARPAPRAVEVTVLHPSPASQLVHAAVPPAANDVDASVLDRLTADEQAATVRALGDAPPTVARLYTDVLLGSIVHDLAVIRYLLGGTLVVEHADAWPDGDEPQSVSLAGVLRDGIRVSIGWHYLERYPAYREEVRVHDELGTVALAFPSPYLLNAPTVLTVVGSEDGGEQVAQYRSTVEAFEEQWLAFADYLLEGVPPRAGIAEGRADVVACESAAAMLAARRGVILRGETNPNPVVNPQSAERKGAL